MAIDNSRYTYKEIALASGINIKTVMYRGKMIGCNVREGITYEQAKQIVGYRPRRNPTARSGMVDRLRLQLKNDGFRVK